MITDTMKSFIEAVPVAFVASTDKQGHPHVAAGKELNVPDAFHVVFENWFCPTTLTNIADSPRVAIAVTDPATGSGYQLVGDVVQVTDAAILDGYTSAELPGTPQVLSRLRIRIDGIMEFAAGVHSDVPLSR